MFSTLSMPVLYLFASIRQPFLDTFFAYITELGEATVFIAVVAGVLLNLILNYVLKDKNEK